MEKEVSVSIEAVLSNPDLMTGDNISALVGGHGGLVVATASAANSIGNDILKGRDIMLRAKNRPELEVDSVLRNSINAAKGAGAIPANAALLSATLLYLAGTNARVGCPGANRKLGASARMISGADKGGVLLVPIGKSTNKITAFPAVHAIYHASMEGKLTKVKGSELPLLGPLYGHGSLSQDYVFPELCENAARIGTEAMINAQSGMGMMPNNFVSAILATAATMEILHPDAEFEVKKDGNWVTTDTSEMAGGAAAKTAKLPGKLHFKGTHEELGTARVIGDLGLMFKDIGTPTVVGMLAFAEIMGCLEESGSGAGGGPLCAPMPHQIGADCAIVLRALSQTKSVEKAAELVKAGKATYLDPEMGMVAANTISRKIHGLNPGPVTQAIIDATSADTRRAVEKRAEESYKQLKSGKSVSEVVKSLDDGRVHVVEKSASKMFSAMLGKDVEIKVKKLAAGARMPADMVKYYGFDIDADVEVSIAGQKMLLKGVTQNIIPDIVIRGDKTYKDVLPLAAIPLLELCLSAHTIINLTVPTAVACAMKISTPEQAATDAEKAAYVTAAIPGTQPRARKVGELALRMMN
jgi:hypothetical protein